MARLLRVVQSTRFILVKWGEPLPARRWRVLSKGGDYLCLFETSNNEERKHGVKRGSYLMKRARGNEWRQSRTVVAARIEQGARSRRGVHPW